jgi:CRISPR-associated protein (TIGR03984 family)
MSLSLYTYSEENLALADAILNFKRTLNEGDESAIALLYSARRCRLLRLEQDGGLSDEKGGRDELASFFEARIFNSRAELRWLNHELGRGRAALISEDDKLDVFGGRCRKEEAVCRIKQRYLLWGEGTGESVGEGWSHLATARIGELLVPLSGVKRYQRVQITAIEYLKEYKYGNVGVFDERLTGLVKEEKSNG